MYSVLVGVLLFAVVCGVALFLAVAAGRQVGRTASGSRPASVYVQYISDKQSLNKLGYAQQLSRNWSGWGTFSASFATMSVLGGAALYFGPVYALTGAWGFSIALPVAALFAFALAAAQAELAAALPTAGGCYHWALARGGQGFGFAAAWLRGFGDLALLVLLAGAGALLVQPFAATYAGLGNGWLSFMLCAALLLGSQALVAWTGRRWVALFLQLGTWLQILLVAGVAAGLFLFIGPRLQPAEFLFTLRPETAGSGGWLAMMMAVLLMFRLFSGSDAAAYTMEEATAPEQHVPWNIYLAPVYGFLACYVLLAVLALSTAEATVGAGGSSGSGLFMTLLGKGLGVWNGWLAALVPLAVLGALWGSGLGVLNASSRMWFAFFRDRRSAWGRSMAAVSTERQTPGRLIAALVLVGLAVLGTLQAVRPWDGSHGLASENMRPPLALESRTSGELSLSESLARDRVSAGGSEGRIVPERATDAQQPDSWRGGALGTDWLWLLTAVTLLGSSAAAAIPLGLELLRPRGRRLLQHRLSAESSSGVWQLGSMRKTVCWIAFVWLLFILVMTVVLLSIVAAVLSAGVLLSAFVVNGVIGNRRRQFARPLSHEEMLHIEQRYRHM
ncbi:amino acid permease [Paenibacillus sp. SYP-B4298]|uniref:amino acid permease n=1 Tax=Paenibacillus sp. SYP-B4298 TaxID=2996034 RepID=UPI0022DDB2DA|nr:APC family permease [Paenibacillus sp. SYP-B4298]